MESIALNKYKPISKSFLRWNITIERIHLNLNLGILTLGTSGKAFKRHIADYIQKVGHTRLYDLTFSHEASFRFREEPKES